MRTRPRILTLLLLLLAEQSARAQIAAGGSDTTIVPWGVLTERARLRDTLPAGGIVFPSMLRSARGGGDVRLHVIVGVDGVPEMIRADSGTHPLLGSISTAAVRRWRLTPPILNGRAVRADMPVYVSFRTPTDRVPLREVSAVVSDSTGFHIALGFEMLPPTAGLIVTRVDSIRAVASVFTELFKFATPLVASAVCVAQDDHFRTNISDDVLGLLRAEHPKVRNANRCPPTYTSMVLHLDASGKPVRPPAPDPVWVAADSARFWTVDIHVYRGIVAQGTGTTEYCCEARRPRQGDPWKAQCDVVSRWVS